MLNNNIPITHPSSPIFGKSPSQQRNVQLVFCLALCGMLTIVEAVGTFPNFLLAIDEMPFDHTAAEFFGGVQYCIALVGIIDCTRQYHATYA